MPADHEMSDRVYAALKRDLVDGDLGYGRLRIGAFHDRYLSSATPVREALLRLVGEGILEMPTTGGFVQPVLTESKVRDLYGATQLLVLAAFGWEAGGALPIGAPDENGNLIPPIDRLFEEVVARTGNHVLLVNVRSLNDRMRRIRRAEARCMLGIDREFIQCERQFRRGERASFRRSLIAYHRRRLRHLPGILAELARED